MNLEEHAGKRVLAESGVRVPRSRLAATPAEAAAAVEALGPAVVKAQVPAGKRGKAGGVRLVATPAEAEATARAILGLEIGGFRVERLLVEEQVPIAREFYAAVLNDPAAKSPLVLLGTVGGMEIEEVTASRPETLRRCAVDIRRGFAAKDAAPLLAGLDLEPAVRRGLAETLGLLYRVYRATDAELVEVNPLAVTAEGAVVALDCKLAIDDAALPRQEALASAGSPEPLTELEARGRTLGLRYIELDGSVGLLANGAGLTMTTMDAIRHFGGSPANFLEIGGDSYTKATPALELVLANRRVRSLLVNFCGAFARTDVMTEGVVRAIEELKPDLPIAFSVHGTGEDEAQRLLRERLGVEPHDRMDDAVRAAVEAAR